MAAGLCQVLAEHYEVTLVVNEQCLEFFNGENLPFRVAVNEPFDIDLDDAYECKHARFLQQKHKQEIFADKINVELDFLHLTNETVKPDIKWVNTYLRL